MRAIIKIMCILPSFMLLYSIGVGQEDIVQATRREVDTILERINNEKNQDKRFDLILTIYDTRIEGYPLLILETFQKLLVIAKKYNDIIAESNAYSFAGQGYRLSGMHIKGLEFHHKAIALAEQSENLSVLAWAQNQIGHIYKDREENDKAISFYKAAQDNARRGKTKDLEGWPMMNLSAVYLVANQPDSSLFYGMQAYDKIVSRAGFASQEAYIFSNMAGAYSKLGNNAKAIEFYQRAMRAASKSQSPRYKGIAYVSYAEHFQRAHQNDSCIIYAKKAIDVVQNSLFNYMAIKPSKMLMDIYENSNADSTIKYLKIFRAANDSLNNTRANQQLQMMTFEEDQRTRDLAAEKAAYRDKIRTNLLLAGLGVVLLIALILYRNNRQKQKANAVLEVTLANLKSTQSQLIQSEKMASLGELTAGIAHEIQNPLNFVNNFSEINKELIEEVKGQKSKLKTEELDELLNDIASNEEKINHHGKRADAIVKGMLQHSQNSKGQKEPTDINALADEYLRLAFHGARAKDNSFNVVLKTNFDESLGNINVIPQELGRVVLNLITNAFHAVDEKTKSGVGDYEPQVSLRSKKENGSVLLSVEDNGNGIPPAIVDKIFQPFFTTKPTGQGTGLGLSLAYDIVKAHGGEIKVNTEEGRGTLFIIHLPVSNA